MVAVVGGRKTVARDPPTTTAGSHYDEQMSGGEMGRKGSRAVQCAIKRAGTGGMRVVGSACGICACADTEPCLPLWPDDSQGLCWHLWPALLPLKAMLRSESPTELTQPLACSGRAGLSEVGTGDLVLPSPERGVPGGGLDWPAWLPPSYHPVLWVGLP